MTSVLLLQDGEGPARPPLPHRWRGAHLKKRGCLFYGPYFMASPVNLSLRWAFAPSYYCVFHCLASCLRQIGFPTGGINKDNPIADSISPREGWWRPAAALLGGKDVEKRPVLGPRGAPSALARSENHDLYLLPDADKLDLTFALSLDNGGNVNMWVNSTFKGGREVRITTGISESRPDLETLFI